MPNNVSVSISFSEKIIDELDERAEKFGRSRSEVVREILCEYFENNEV